MADIYTQLVFSLPISEEHLAMFKSCVSELEQSVQESQENDEEGGDKTREDSRYVQLVRELLPDDLECYSLPSFLYLKDKGEGGHGFRIHLLDDPYGSPDMLECILHAFLALHELPYVWSFLWLTMCSKPRYGEFDGGACLVAREGAWWVSLSQWLMDPKNILEVTEGRVKDKEGLF